MRKIPRNVRDVHDVDLVGIVYPENYRYKRGMAARAIGNALIALLAADLFITATGGRIAYSQEERAQQHATIPSAKVFIHPVIGGVVVGDKFTFEFTVNGRDEIITVPSLPYSNGNNEFELPKGTYPYMAWLGDRHVKPGHDISVHVGEFTVGEDTRVIGIGVPPHLFDR